jgi:hypothetical protein
MSKKGEISYAQAIAWLEAQPPEFIDNLFEELTEKKKQRPQLIDNPDLVPLKDLLEAGINHIAEHGRESKDFEHYVFEECMIAFYGTDVWDWYNRNVTDE